MLRAGSGPAALVEYNSWSTFTRRSCAELLAERVGDNLKQPVKAVIPLDDKVVVPAANRGVPFIMENKTQPSGRGILALAESVRDAFASADLDES